MSDFSGNSAKLAIESIHNAHYREHYIQITRQVADDIMHQTEQAAILSPCQQYDVWKTGAKKAHNLRNQWMKRTRKRLSPSALAFSRVLKPWPPSFPEMVARYYSRLKGGPAISQDPAPPHAQGFTYLTISSKIRIFRTIIESSGRTNANINLVSKVVGCVGAVLLVSTIALIIYAAHYAQCPIAYAAKLIVTFQTGLLGSYLGSRVGCILGRRCGQGHVTVFVFSLVGGLIVGVVTSVVGNVIVSSVSHVLFSVNVI